MSKLRSHSLLQACWSTDSRRLLGSSLGLNNFYSRRTTRLRWRSSYLGFLSPFVATSARFRNERNHFKSLSYCRIYVVLYTPTLHWKSLNPQKSEENFKKSVWDLFLFTTTLHCTSLASCAFNVILNFWHIWNRVKWGHHSKIKSLNLTNILWHCLWFLV